jgi:hypothetical protein
VVISHVRVCQSRLVSEYETIISACWLEATYYGSAWSELSVCSLQVVIIKLCSSITLNSLKNR